MDCLAGNNMIVTRDRHFCLHTNSSFGFSNHANDDILRYMYNKIIGAVARCPGTCIVMMALSINRKRKKQD